MALEQRLRNDARKQGRDLTRLRQLLVFDRFLARVFHQLGENVIVKGGITLELRLDRARTTKDVDLWMKGDASRTLDRLRELGELDLGDFLSFTVEPDKDHPVMKGEGMVYEGQRFRCEARLAGKLYGGRFNIDVAFADVITIEPEIVQSSSFLDFAGATRTNMRIYPRASAARRGPGARTCRRCQNAPFGRNYRRYACSTVPLRALPCAVRCHSAGPLSR